MKNLKKTSIFILFAAIISISGHFIFNGKQIRNSQLSLLASLAPQPTDESQESGKFKTFVFDRFHGSSDISDKFKFQYPASWHNEGQYFSPQKIKFYDLYSVKAPIYFDLILADIFDMTEFKYQIDSSQRRMPDAVGQIDGREFKRYDLIDYGTYGGESAGRIKIFIGPIIKIDGDDYYLVFHWEERPLTENMPGNDLEVFDNMLLSLKFF